MEAKRISLNKLQPNNGQVEGLPANPRFIKDEKFAKLKKSIEDDPEMLELREIIAYDNGGELVIIMGNMRYRALVDLGYKDALVKVLPQETPVEKLRAMTIKDNVGYGDWDFDSLANEWDTGELTEWGLDSVGKFDGNIDDLFEAAENAANKDKAPVVCPHCGKVISE